MRPQKITDQELTENMLEILRASGYEGSSLNDLAVVGGLKKASLYHRYPGGKETLVQSVLDYYHSNLSEKANEILTGKKKPKKRLNMALDHISEVYKEGSVNCLYRALSLKSGIEIFGEQIAQSCSLWLESFEAIGKELGFKKKKAKKMAIDSLISIQGALVVSRIFSEPKLFTQTLDNIKAAYLGK